MELDALIEQLKIVRESVGGKRRVSLIVFKGDCVDEWEISCVSTGLSPYDNEESVFIMGPKDEPCEDI